MSEHIKKRPILVWIIFILSIINFILFCFVIGMNSGLIPIKEGYALDLSEFILFKNIKMLVMNFIFLFASIMLFRLKAIAFKLYSLHAILEIIDFISTFIYLFAYPSLAFSTFGDISIIGDLLSISITLFLVYYSYRLLKKNILKR